MGMMEREMEREREIARHVNTGETGSPSRRRRRRRRHSVTLDDKQKKLI